MTPLALGESFALLRPAWLLVALAIAALALLGRRAAADADGWRRVLSPAVLAYLGGDSGDGRDQRAGRALLAAALVAVALAAPATRESDAALWRQASGWIVLADVSRSMKLEDTLPSRLGAMRETLLALSGAAGARPLALILYAGDAFLVVPPAFDRRLVDEHAALLDHGVVPLEGSNLARALALAASVVAESRLLGARLFVLGDGGGAGEASEAAVRHLAAAGHRLDLVVFGAPDTAAASAELARAPGDAAAGEASGGAPPVDIAAAERLARAGGGVVVRADGLGRAPLDALALERGGEPETAPGLRAVLWRERSEWLLLALLPLVLALFRAPPARPPGG